MHKAMRFIIWHWAALLPFGRTKKNCVLKTCVLIKKTRVQTLATLSCSFLVSTALCHSVIQLRTPASLCPVQPLLRSKVVRLLWRSSCGYCLSFPSRGRGSWCLSSANRFLSQPLLPPPPSLFCF